MQITVPSFPYALTQETKAMRAGIEKHARQLEHDAANAEQEAAELKAVESCDWTASHDAAATRLRSKRAEHLGRQVEIREQISELIQRVNKIDHPAAYTAACDEMAAATEDIVAGLRSIGYEPYCHNTNIATHDGFEMNFVYVHPRGKRARLAVNSLQGNPGTSDQRDANEREIEKCATKLAAMKATVLAGLA